MAIVGERPSHGARLTVERGAEAASSGWIYTGVVATAEAEHAVRCIVHANGQVEVEGAVPDELREKARLILRTAVKHALDEGVDPPRRIQRWRGEK